MSESNIAGSEKILMFPGCEPSPWIEAINASERMWEGFERPEGSPVDAQLPKTELSLVTEEPFKRRRYVCGLAAAGLLTTIVTVGALKNGQIPSEEESLQETAAQIRAVNCEDRVEQIARVESHGAITDSDHTTIDIAHAYEATCEAPQIGKFVSFLATIGKTIESAFGK